MGATQSDHDIKDTLDGRCDFCPPRIHNAQNHVDCKCILIGQHSALAHCKNCRSVGRDTKNHKCAHQVFGHTDSEHWNNVLCERCGITGHDPLSEHNECDRCDLILLGHSHISCPLCDECMLPTMPHVRKCKCGGCLVEKEYDPEYSKELRCLVCFRTPAEFDRNPYDIKLIPGRIPRKTKKSD